MSKGWAISGSRVVSVEHEVLAGKLEAGWYEALHDYDGVYLRPRKIETERLVLVPSSVGDYIVDMINRFWGAGEAYKRIDILHKRGILLYGAQGIGKTALLSEVCNKHIANDGVVFVASGSLHDAKEMAIQLRNMEPERNLIILLEDIERYIRHGEEEGLLSLLGGQNQVNRVFFLATTNYISELPPRLTNRPSRFDEVIELNSFDINQRLTFINEFAMSDDSDLCRELALKSEGFDVAHLKELIVSVFCLGQNIDQTINRLRKMIDMVDEDNDSNEGDSDSECVFTENGQAPMPMIHCGQD